MMMEEELKKLEWFLEGPFFTVVPPPSPNGVQDITEYLNDNNLTIVSFDVVSNLKRQLEINSQHYQAKMEEMKKEMQKLQIKKDVYVANQKKLVECVRKIAELTDFKESIGSEESKCILVGQRILERLYEHVKSAIGKESSSPRSHDSYSSSCWEAATCATLQREAEDDRGTVKKRRKSVFYSSSDDDGDDQKQTSEITAASPSQGGEGRVKIIKRKLDYVLPPLPSHSGSSSSKLSSSSCSPSSNLSESSTKFRCDRCDDRYETKKEYKKHRKIVHRVLLKSKEHQLTEPIFLSKKKSKHSRIGIPSPSPVVNELMSRTRLVSYDDDSDEEADPNSVNCEVCGDCFRDKATLKFHIKKKHPWKG